MEINVKSKTLYFHPNYKSEKLKIFDKNGILFYSSDFVKNFKGLFFLPKGKYFTDNKIIVSCETLKQPKMNLPLKERDYQNGIKNFKVYFGINKHKCTVFHDQGYILFDESLKNVPKYIKAFILYHEWGHEYYETEHFADLYAVAKMLKEGYNPSQIILCPFSLSNKQEERKVKLLKLFDNYYG